jgi:hypothetical protein
MHELSAQERYAVADAIGMDEQYLYQCLTGRRITPVKWCPSIELHSRARVTCEELRADVAWHRAPDPNWPRHNRKGDPQGRPCVDVEAPWKPAPSMRRVAKKALAGKRQRIGAKGARKPGR